MKSVHGEDHMEGGSPQESMSDGFSLGKLVFSFSFDFSEIKRSSIGASISQL